MYDWPLSRRSFLSRGAAFKRVAQLAASADWAPFKEDLTYLGPGGLRRSLDKKLAEIPSLLDFGVVGDGETDDSEAIQAAVDWAGASPGAMLRVPPRIHGLRKPILIPESVELLGELPGAGNTPLCGFRALPGFQSLYSQRYWSGQEPRELSVSALLISKGWAENADFNQRIHLRDLIFDVDGMKDDRGGPIHGVMLTNQQMDLHNVWVRSATGFGIWINTQRRDGAFMLPMVDNVLRRVWVRGAGVGGASYRTDAGDFQYSGFMIGALPGSRDPDGKAEPPLATDGILDYCTVAVGPEAGIGCRGSAIHITQSAGWRVTGCHVNGAGKHGVALDKAYQTELSGCYLDGWGVGVSDDEGTFGGVWCRTIISSPGGADGALIVSSNRIRARAVGSKTGNRFVGVSLHAGASGTARAVVLGNILVKRKDADHAFTAFEFTGHPDGRLAAMVVANEVSGAAATFLDDWSETKIQPRFTGNSFQYEEVAPAEGWYPIGFRIENVAPAPGGWTGWVRVLTDGKEAWRGYGRIAD